MRLRAIAFVLVAGASVGAYAIGGLAALERGSIDLRFRVRGLQAPDPRISIVAVDDRTAALSGRMPPLPRHYYAQALDRLHAGGARLIVVDVQFSNPGPSPADDDALVTAITRAGPVVLAAPDDGESPNTVPAGRPGTEGAVLAAAGVDPDPDGILRSLMFRQVELPTLAARAASMLTGHEFSSPTNHARIDFRGGPGSFPTISLIDLVDGRVPADRIAGRTFLIGVTAPIQHDVFLTPAGRVPLSGVEVHANALHTLLAGTPLRDAPIPADVALILLAAGLPLLLGLRLSSVQILPTAVLLLVGAALGAQLAFGHGRIVALVPTTAALLLGTAAAISVDTWTERRRRRALEAALSDFVRPADAAFFVSYRRNQSEFVADVLRAELAGRFGEHSVFLDKDHLVAGQRWPMEIREAIRGCSVMLVLIGPHWADAANPDGTRRLDDPDDWVRREVETGLEQPETVVVPVLINGAAMPPAAGLPESLAGLTEREAFELSGGTVRADVDRLVHAIQRVRNDSEALAR